MLYRFRVIDRLPEAPSPATARGTLVHAVLERLFDVPAVAARSLRRRRACSRPQWDKLAGGGAGAGGPVRGRGEREVWLEEAAAMVTGTSRSRTRRGSSPPTGELHVEAVLASGLALRGYIDRLDVAPGGEIRIVDYKTGTAPRADFEARALFQMRFYALVLWRSQGTIPRLLQLIYLGNGEIVRYAPDEADLLATERKIEALWRAIERATQAGDWRPRAREALRVVRATSRSAPRSAAPRRRCHRLPRRLGSCSRSPAAGTTRCSRARRSRGRRTSSRRARPASACSEEVRDIT